MTWTDVSHYQGLRWWGPFSHARLAGVLERIDLPIGARVLDVGCGSGSLLAHFAQRGAHVTGIDRSSAALDSARARLHEAAPSVACSLLEMEMAAFDAPPSSFDLIANLGGPFLGETYEATLQAYATWLAPRGWFLSGHGFWRQAPPPAYLAATGLPADAFVTDAANLVLAQTAGFDLVHEAVCSREAFDHFEDTLLANRVAHAASHPADTEFQRVLASKRAWHEAQARWGRDTMGFALYLYRRRA